MSPKSLESLVSPEWLAAHLQDPDLVVIDGSWYLPAMNRDPKQEYAAGHIPGAVFFDVDAISDHTSSLPHMLPSEADFATAMSTMGIGDTARAVVYDGLGLLSAARVWWTLRVFGMSQVAVLDGGLPAWRAAGLPVEDRPVARQPANFSARLNRAAVADAPLVRANIETGTHRVLDARGAERFEGRAGEPRPGLRSGHIPGSRNIPFTAIAPDGRLLPPDRLRAAFLAAGDDASKPVITSCGSGVSAAILTLALVLQGRDPGLLYDGSWTEWGGDPELPVATGPA